MGIKKKDYIVYGVSLAVLVLVFWQLYYNLQITFLAKSASIFISGVVLFALSWLLHHENKDDLVEVEGEKMKKYFSLILVLVTLLIFVGLVAKTNGICIIVKVFLLNLDQSILVQFYKVTIWHWLMS